MISFLEATGFVALAGSIGFLGAIIGARRAERQVNKHVGLFFGAFTELMKGADAHYDDGAYRSECAVCGSTDILFLPQEAACEGNDDDDDDDDDDEDDGGGGIILNDMPPQDGDKIN